MSLKKKLLEETREKKRYILLITFIHTCLRNLLIVLFSTSLLLCLLYLSLIKEKKRILLFFASKKYTSLKSFFLFLYPCPTSKTTTKAHSQFHDDKNHWTLFHTQKSIHIFSLGRPLRTIFCCCIFRFCHNLELPFNFGHSHNS